MCTRLWNGTSSVPSAVRDTRGHVGRGFPICQRDQRCLPSPRVLQSRVPLRGGEWCPCSEPRAALSHSAHRGVAKHLCGLSLSLRRFRKTWRLRALKDGKASGRPAHSLGQLVPERPKPTPGLVPLISPPVSPSSPGSDSASRHSRPDARGPQSPYDVSNRDYFFPG